MRMGSLGTQIAQTLEIREAVRARPSKRVELGAVMTEQLMAMDRAVLLNVKELAVWLRVKPSWVYAHADELGAFRLGKYLRFALPRVMERLEKGAVGSSVVGSITQRPLASGTSAES
jgi:hypothetical protein